jgi:molybdopterin biosynthesis enzyme
MFEKAVIIPTGDEIKEGIVLDTDSPMIMQELIRLNPLCRIARRMPINDLEDRIAEAVSQAASEASDLVVIIGGSGGGHRYSATLGKDFTHSALEALLSPQFSGEIYGKNGHMWCKLLCGRVGDTLVVNVPGPFREAQAAMEAFACTYAKTPEDLKEINRAMLEAVIKQYPVTALRGGDAPHHG